jgi:hypothetical protein
VQASSIKMSIVKVNPYMIEPLEIENYSITANANVIFNSLTGRVEMSSYTRLPGTVAGYTSGGFAPGTVNTIDKFPFASDANASDVGDLTQSRYGLAGQSSTSSGYTSGGFITTAINTVDKFPFAANANASDVGDLTQSRYHVAGQSSTASGYTSGGDNPSLTPSIRNIIDKFPFSSNANASDVGDLTQSRYRVAGQSSISSGYTSGGSIFAAQVNTIDKFPFATDANASDVGDLTQIRTSLTGQSSTSSGYTSGGDAPGNVNTIDKFPFAADANASNVGDLTQVRDFSAGQQI